jgi:hypothetical protein
MAQSQGKQLIALALGFGLHRTKKNFLIVVFEPLLEDRHDIHSLRKIDPCRGKTVAFRGRKTSPEKRDKMGRKTCEFRVF